MKNIEEYSIRMIAAVGSAKSKYLEALKLAGCKEFEKAAKCVEEGKEIFLDGHKVHAELLAKSAGAEDVTVSLLLAHAEDQLMSAETIQIMVEEFIRVYKTL